MKKIYRNYDLNVNNFFLKKDLSEIVTNISDLKFKQLARNIYFKPSHCPSITIADTNEGSCFEDYLIPSASFEFKVINGSIVSNTIEKNLSINTYIDNLYNDISSRIDIAYKTHNTITLAYSGGIDSMVLLSFIQAKGLLSRTDIVCFKNLTQQHNSCLHQNSKNVEALLDQIKHKVRSITWIDITLQDIASQFNCGKLEHLKCYVTTAMLKQIKNTAFMFGHHGNAVLLHKDIFLDEIILADETAKEKINNIVNSRSNFYTQSIINYDTTKTPIGLERRHLLVKPWELVIPAENTIYSPLGDTDTFDQLRRLDFSQIDPEDIIDAKFAKEFIMQNSNNLLDYLTYESVREYDSLSDAIIPIDLIDINLLTIPKNLTHNTDGVTYLQEEIENAHNQKFIPINSLVAIKALNWIDSL